MNYKLNKLFNILLGSIYSLSDEKKRFSKFIKNNTPEQIIFVCKGNICRSPYAEFKFNSLNKNIKAISAGLEANSNEPANFSAITNSLKRSVDLKSHKTKNLNILNLEKSAIFVLEPMQALQILIRNPSVKTISKIFLLGNFQKNASMSVIPDPYGREDNFFQKVYEMIDSAVIEINDMISQILTVNKNT